MVNLPNIGFSYSTDQLFWLTALPGLSGATLRIFYSFMVPIFGGRTRFAVPFLCALQKNCFVFMPWQALIFPSGFYRPPYYRSFK